LKVFYTDPFWIPIPENHRFPVRKYARLRKRILDAGIVPPDNLRVPRAATQEEMLRAHSPGYLKRLQKGALTDKEIRQIGLPWSPEMVERARRSAGATIQACRHALTEWLAINLGGGTHHAFSDQGQGYCLLNDSAIAVRTLQAESRVRHVLILDCDVHQGNGTAAIFKGDSTVFTFSIHGKYNFPFHKEKSDLDIAMENGADDATYLEALQRGLLQALASADADLVIYLAGADPYRKDQLGRLSLSKEGLAERDRIVFRLCGKAELPVAVTMAGGYATEIEDTVDIHFQTVISALQFQKAMHSRKRDPALEPKPLGMETAQ